MCDAETWCDKDDDPLAILLWKSDRPARLEVRCGPGKGRGHPIARLYDLQTGLTVVQPGFVALTDHHDLSDERHGLDDRMHVHADAFSLTDSGRRVENWWGRCRCGTRTYTKADLERGLVQPSGRSRDGVPYMYANFSWSSRERHAVRKPQPTGGTE